jgi:hypothetical protein
MKQKDVIRSCSECRTKIAPGEERRYLKAVLCEDCYMNRRMTRSRKTHWQYLRSIKTDYLKPGKRPKGNERIIHNS